MKKAVEILSGMIFCVAALLFFAYLALFQLGEQESFFLEQIQENQLEQVVGLDATEIIRAYEQVFDFSEGKRETLADSADSFTYSGKEIRHMEDVRALFLLLRTLAWISFGVMALILFFVLTKRLSGVKIWVSSLASLCVIGLLAFAAMNQFQAAFIRFHELLFANELWLLDPKTDFLIQIMPEAFFVEAAAKILFLRILMGYGLLHGLLGAIYKYKKSVLAE